MDALVELLMKQYKIPRAQAEQYASDIHSRAGVNKNKIDSAEAGELRKEDALQTEAYAPAARKAVTGMYSLTERLNKFKELAKKRDTHALDPADEAWYQKIRGAHDQNIRANAQSAQQNAQQLDFNPAKVQNVPQLDFNSAEVQSVPRAAPPRPQAPAPALAGPGLASGAPPSQSSSFAQNQREYQRQMALRQAGPFAQGPAVVAAIHAQPGPAQPSNFGMQAASNSTPEIDAALEDIFGPPGGTQA